MHAKKITHKDKIKKTIKAILHQLVCLILFITILYRASSSKSWKDCNKHTFYSLEKEKAFRSC